MQLFITAHTKLFIFESVNLLKDLVVFYDNLKATIGKHLNDDKLNIFHLIILYSLELMFSKYLY